MLVEPVTGSGKSMALSPQVKLPTDQDAAQRNDDAKKSVQTLSLVELSELATDVQRNVNIIHNVDFQFSVHKASGKMMVTVVDESTGKVVREIPSQELLDLSAKIDEMVGMIFDQKG